MIAKNVIIAKATVTLKLPVGVEPPPPPHFIYSKNGYPTYLNEVFTAVVDPSGVVYGSPDTLPYAVHGDQSREPP